ncbi:MAG: TatD family hydrolase [Candidatus Omnitrophota bacterium]|nr:MAG: TatD family hydrolase [Candidatus Omnitrophota bacterium]
MLIDSHCHLNSLSGTDRERVISSAQATDIICLNSSIDYKDAQGSVALANKYPFIYAAVGFHPFSVQDYSLDVVKKYGELIDRNKKVVAVGEVGLDCHARSPQDAQEPILREFIKLACSKGVPVMIHNRLQGYRILDILDEFFPSYQGVVFHCFSYGEDFLDKILEREGVVSFSLNVLRNKKDIISSLKKCPLQNLLLETDSPYMKAGARPSTPLDIRQVYRAAAAIKNIEESALEEALYSNAQRIFKLT